MKWDVLGIFKSEDGEYSEGRLFAIAGKAIVCVYLIKYHAALMADPLTLGMLFAVLVLPKLFEKVLYMRVGGKNGPA